MCDNDTNMDNNNMGDNTSWTPLHIVFARLFVLISIEPCSAARCLSGVGGGGGHVLQGSGVEYSRCGSFFCFKLVIYFTAFLFLVFGTL